MCGDSTKSCSAFKYGVIGFFIGAAAGAITALLLTPKTGEELRAEIKKAILEISDKIEEKAKEVKDITREKYIELMNSTVETYNKAKDFTQREIDIIKKIILEKKDLESQ